MKVRRAICCKADPPFVDADGGVARGELHRCAMSVFYRDMSWATRKPQRLTVEGAKRGVERSGRSADPPVGQVVAMKGCCATRQNNREIVAVDGQIQRAVCP